MPRWLTRTLNSLGATLKTLAFKLQLYIIMSPAYLLDWTVEDIGMRDFADLMGSIAWPMVYIITIILLIEQIKKVILALTNKIETATKIKIGKGGIDLAEEIARSRIYFSENKSELSKDKLLIEFDSTLKEYDECSISDIGERVAARTRLADRLGELALSLKIPRTELASSQSEGKLVALATITIKKPAASDLAYLDKAAKTAMFKFTRYRIILGLLPTLAGGELSTSALRRIAKIIDRVESRPDSPPDISLQRLIDRTRETLANLNATSN